nr:microfibril-associated glycoprotein 4-like [Pocillopora verrucosa]
MTDTQERVVINQNTNGLRFEFLRRLENSFITSERFIYGTIATVVVVVAVFYHKHAINSHEARFETTVEAIQKLEEKVVRELNVLRGLLVSKNCAEVYKSGGITSGVYRIKPDGARPDFEVFCDQKTTNGGWTVVQKRLDGSVLFDRGWSDYKNGFGNLDGEFWLGLEKIHHLTKSPSKLRVDLEDFDGETSYAEYDLIVVATERKKYQLSVGKYSGRAGDSLTQHHGYPFSTKDRDHDSHSSNCAEKYKGGWWHIDCYYSNLNGVYRHGGDSATTFGIRWNSWKGKPQSMKRAEMKIRPVKV